MGTDQRSQAHLDKQIGDQDRAVASVHDSPESDTTISRRSTLRLGAALGGAGLLGAGAVATASATSASTEQSVNTSSEEYTDELIREALKDVPHGGGEEYTESDGKLHPSDADTAVSTLEELQDALDSSAEIIAIEDDIYVGDAELDLGNKTVVGDRGWDGSEGPLLHTDVGGYTEGGFRYDRPYTMFYSTVTSGDTPRVTGIRMRGHMVQYDSWDRYDYDTHLSRHVTFSGDRGEVDNCEMWGTAWNDVHALGDVNQDIVAEIDVHHCVSYDSWQVGYGYGIGIWSGFAHIHHNYFNNHRHCIDGYGWPESGYICEENIFGPSQYSHAIDMHCLTENSASDIEDPDHPEFGLRAGGAMDIRHNTFCHTYDEASAISIRGVPLDHVHIHNNRFLDEEAPPYNSGNDREFTWQQQNIHAVWNDIRLAPDGEYTDEWSHYDNQFDAANEAWTPEYGASVDILGAGATFEVSDPDIPASVAQGDVVDVSATVTNSGSTSGTKVIELSVGDNVVASEEVTLEGGADTTVSLSFETATLNPGTYNVGLSSEDASTSGELTVEHSVTTYATDDGEVETSGLRAAIDDWRGGDIESELLRDVIDAWRSS